MAEHDLDAIVAVTNGPAWVTDPVNGDLGGNFDLFVGSSTASAVSGYGSITVPAGHIGPLPIGISLIGGRWSEPELIGFAFDFEQATQVRVPPQFLATTSAASASSGRDGKAHGKGAADHRGEPRGVRLRWCARSAIGHHSQRRAVSPPCPSRTGGRRRHRGPA